MLVLDGRGREERSLGPRIAGACPRYGEVRLAAPPLLLLLAADAEGGLAACGGGSREEGAREATALQRQEAWPRPRAGGAARQGEASALRTSRSLHRGGAGADARPWGGAC